jgi:hypothetical protein
MKWFVWCWFLALLLGAFGCVIEEEVTRAGGEDSLALPQRFAHPGNDDEYFFNFRLEQFGAETEDLIKETFGSGLAVEGGSFWEFDSYTSHAVSFATNLPSVSVVEYGETKAYGERTEVSDSYYYQHLHHIKGLRANTTYHFRYRVQDADGVVAVSEDHSFTTLGYSEEVIRIPEDMEGGAPFTISRSGKYVLTQDLDAQTLGINIRANDVTIDLDGHTLTYDIGTPKVTGASWDQYAYNEEASFGIRAGLWNYLNAKVYNGVIRQGRNGGKGFIGIGFNPLFLNHMGAATQNEVAGVLVDYYGDSVTGMVAGSGRVHHNVIVDRGSVIDDRHQGIKALTVTGDSPGNEVAYNSIRRFRHQGIRGGAAIHHNELYSDSFDTNSFMLVAQQGGRIEDNKLFGTGYNPIGIGWSEDLLVRRNFIYLHATAPSLRSDEYDRLSGVAGVRLTIYDKNFPVSNILYEDNTIVVKAWAECFAARGIWTWSGNARNIVYRRNTVKSEVISEEADFLNFSSAMTAVDVNGNSEAPLDEVAWPMIFEDNRLIGNMNLITFGSSYGIGSGAWFYRTRMERLRRLDDHFAPVRLGYWYWNTHSNRLIDTDTGEGVSLDAPAFHGSDGFMEVSIGESRELLFADGEGAPVGNTPVRVSFGASRSFEVKTDPGGRVSFDMLLVQHLKENGLVSRTAYSQYSFAPAGYLPQTVGASRLKAGAVTELRFSKGN